MSPDGPCAEKKRLAVEFSRTAEAYASSVSLLAQQIGVLLRADYEQLHQETETARGEAERARLALESHKAEHGC